MHRGMTHGDRVSGDEVNGRRLSIHTIHDYTPLIWAQRMSQRRPRFYLVIAISYRSLDCVQCVLLLRGLQPRYLRSFARPAGDAPKAWATAPTHELLARTQHTAAGVWSIVVDHSHNIRHEQTRGRSLNILAEGSPLIRHAPALSLGAELKQTRSEHSWIKECDSCLYTRLIGNTAEHEPLQ